MLKNVKYMALQCRGRKKEDTKMIKRISTPEERARIKEALEFKNITAENITNAQLKKLIIHIAKKLGIM